MPAPQTFWTVIGIAITNNLDPAMGASEIFDGTFEGGGHGGLV